MSDQDRMIDSLKTLVVPDLRKRGFNGSFPHFRRLAPGHIDLLTFQFDRHGGGFVIEISQCGTEGFKTHWGKQIPPSKVSAHDLHPDQRYRIQPGSEGSTDSWFRYDKAGSKEHYQEVARSVLPYFERAEEAWKDFGRFSKSK